MAALREKLLVTVGLLEGEPKVGRMAKFSPYLNHLLLEPTDGKGGKPVKIRTSEVAYVAIHKDGSVSHRRPQTGMKRIAVHIAGGRTLDVEAPTSAINSQTGFYAFPIEAESTFKEIFFFASGVNAREDSEPLGSILIKDGLLKPSELEMAVSSQNAQRNLPLGQILVQQQKLPAEAVESAAALQARKRLRIGEVLIEAGLATDKDIEQALNEQRKKRGKRLGEVLVDLNIITEESLISALAKKFHMPFVDLDHYPINPAAAEEVAVEMMEKHRIFPVNVDDKSFTIAISDPLATDATDMLRFKLKKRIVEVLATPSQVRSYITSLSAGVSQDRNRLLGSEGRELTTILDEMAVESGHEDEAADSAVGNVDSGVIKLCNQIILDGYRRGASDIHVEPNGKESDVTVRFRIDGECVVYQQLPASLRNTLVARIKIMAGLDISERRKPQDGKINFRLPNGKLELRVATLPTAGGEDAVLRILTSSKPPPLGEVGMSERDFREFRKLIRRPYGLMLCVGPTGSGKTTTLHSALRDINTQDLKIWTAEDPVEITQPGLRQVQMNAKIGLSFATILRAFLRADPDVIMVGEMRDQETAGIVVEASLTGHLVFSTLHTNNAPETISRLLDMGLDAFSFADALLGVLAQRLARRLCRCAEAYMASEEERAEIISLYGEGAFPNSNGGAKEIPLWRPKGCELCGHTGYKGRLSIHELLVATEPIKRAMQQKATAEDIRLLAIKEGMTTLLQDGIAKVLLGKTDLKQVLAVCRR